MDEETIDQPAQAEVEAETMQEPVTDEVETGEGNPEEDTEAEESEEVEYEGKKYSVPKELKEALLRHSDYTRKTQEVAEQRRALEAHVAQFQQAQQMQQANLQGYAQLMALDSQLQQFANVDFQALSDSDPVEAQKQYFAYQELSRMRDRLAGNITAYEQQRQIEQQQSIARHIDEGRKVLEREYAWSEDKGRATTEYIKSYQHLGVTDEAVRALNSGMYGVAPIVWAHKAHLYDQMMKKAQQKPAAEAPKPVTRVGQKAGANKDPDKMSTDEWLKWREGQLKRRA